MNNGWVCPKCGAVWAPYVRECYKCNAYTLGHPFKVEVCDHMWVNEPNADTTTQGFIKRCAKCGAVTFSSTIQCGSNAKV